MTRRSWQAEAGCGRRRACCVYIRAAAGRRPSFDTAFGGRKRAAGWGREPQHIRSIAQAAATWVERMGKAGPQAAGHRRGEKGPATSRLTFPR